MLNKNNSVAIVLLVAAKHNIFICTIFSEKINDD